MLGPAPMLRLNKSKKSAYYGLAQDPYLEIAYHVMVSLLAFCILLLGYLFFQWPDFLIFLIISVLLIFISAFPLGQSRWGQIKAVLMISAGLWISFVGVFVNAESKLLTIAWVFCYSLGCYIISLRNNNLRLYLGLSIVFLPIYIHLLADATLLSPINSSELLINYSSGFAICALYALIVALLAPRRSKAKVLLAMTAYIYALRRVLLSENKHEYRDNLYDMYSHLYYLREQRDQYHQRFDQDFLLMMSSYIDVIYQIGMTYAYVLNNPEVKLPFYQASIWIDRLLAEKEWSMQEGLIKEQKDWAQVIESPLLKDALTKIEASVVRLVPIYQEIKKLRKKYA